MHQNLDFISEAELTEWVNSHLDSAAKVLSSGYQGRTLLFDNPGHPLVIKVALGNLLTRPINLALLRHEYRIYQKLDGMKYIPACYGMANNEFLVIEYIPGETIRDNRPDSESAYYEKLFSAIQEMHQRGVAHFDLKRKENLLVSNQGDPVIIDFGVSIAYKGGWHLLNAYLFKLARQFDMNAWVRHKSNRKYDSLSESDLQFYHKTLLEKVALKCKRIYKDKILRLFGK